jgi:ribosome-binding factor A
MIPNRKARLASLILEEISIMLHRDLKDPRLEMVSITEVDISEDLRYAKVYFCLYGDERQKSNAQDGFESAQGFIKRELIKRLNIKRVPELMFVFDTSYDNADRITRLLGEIKKDNE